MREERLEYGRLLPLHPRMNVGHPLAAERVPSEGSEGMEVLTAALGKML
jgi:hypothetical protein